MAIADTAIRQTAGFQQLQSFSVEGIYSDYYIWLLLTLINSLSVELTAYQSLSFVFISFQ